MGNLELAQFLPPKEVDEIMRHVPKGKLITINNIREIIAERYNATISCPMTTGIFAWISANAAEEMLAEGKKKNGHTGVH